MTRPRVPTRQAVEDYVLEADLVIGAVLVPRAAAPKLITEQLVRDMKRGSVLVDISIGAYRQRTPYAIRSFPLIWVRCMTRRKLGSKGSRLCSTERLFHIRRSPTRHS